MLQLAIPNKGALSEDSVRLLQGAGYRCTRYGRELMVSDRENGIDFVFLRPRDIALYVGNGVIDLGITGRDLEIDSRADVTELMELGFGKSRFCFAVPRDSGLTVEKLGGLRIATSYPELLKKNLAERGLDCRVVRLDGAVEISIRLGVADAIADVVESGATLREAGLAIIGEPMLASQAVLIGRNPEQIADPTVKRLIARLRGVLVAGAYAMIEYDIPRSALEAGCRITPGIEAPTVSPLANPEWVAVKAMVLRKECNRIMDELYDIGARGIITSDIAACRL
ncbi:MAG: ATP phosphoribosyltransferase [Victivallaceae bacterium]|nr:ATP phosphoribosyltransferase [Victivallaceae bacterium]